MSDAEELRYLREDLEDAVDEAIEVLRRHGGIAEPPVPDWLLPETARDIVRMLGALCDRLAEPRPAAPPGPALDALWEVLRSTVNRELSGESSSPFGQLLAQEVMYGLERRGWRLVWGVVFSVDFTRWGSEGVGMIRDPRVRFLRRGDRVIVTDEDADEFWAIVVGVEGGVASVSTDWVRVPPEG